jgi:hypothetical protein
VFNGRHDDRCEKICWQSKSSKQCVKCYDQEKSGFFSLRLSSNKHFGHNIGMTEKTQQMVVQILLSNIGIYDFQIYVTLPVAVVAHGSRLIGMKIIKN